MCWGVLELPTRIVNRLVKRGAVRHTFRRVSDVVRCRLPVMDWLATPRR